MDFNRATAQTAQVALLAEGVDRNIRTTEYTTKWQSVALLAEGVDRNPDGHRQRFAGGG